MIHIDHLNIQLPEELRHRARRIHNIIAEKLSETSFNITGYLSCVSPTDVSIDPSASDQKIAHQIAGTIAAEISKSGGRL